MAQGERFSIRKIGLGAKLRGEVGLIPSGLNYIVAVFRGQIPSWDPYAIRLRISREPAITRNYNFIICDTPPELFPPTIWGLYAADYIIIPSNLEELSLAGVKLLLKDIIPEVIMRSRERPKVLGVMLINVTKKYKTIEDLGNKIREFVGKLPSPIKDYIYDKPLFNSIIHRYDELKDLIYRPRRWEIPVSRIIGRIPELNNEVENVTNEVLHRISNFKGVGV